MVYFFLGTDWRLALHQFWGGTMKSLLEYTSYRQYIADYYADSPQLQDLAEKAVYKTSVPVWVHIVLFLCWGWLMYRLWVRVDRKKR